MKIKTWCLRKFPFPIQLQQSYLKHSTTLNSQWNIIFFSYIYFLIRNWIKESKLERARYYWDYKRRMNVYNRSRWTQDKAHSSVQSTITYLFELIPRERKKIDFVHEINYYFVFKRNFISTSLHPLAITSARFFYKTKFCSISLSKIYYFLR